MKKGREIERERVVLRPGAGFYFCHRAGGKYWRGSAYIIDFPTKEEGGKQKH